MNSRIRRWSAALAPLALVACVSTPPQRPAAVVQGERFLILGVSAYRADDYADAAALFGKGLDYYQGLDDRARIVACRIDLAETALAVGNPVAAEQQLTAAQPLVRDDHMVAAQQRLQLLQSTIAIRQGRYDAAVAQLTPLLSAPDTPAALRRSALANRLDVALHRAGDPPQPWLKRFAAAARDSGDPLLNARLLRFQAVLKARNGEDDAAVSLLTGALARYKGIPDRAGIAATLEQWGGLLARQRRWAAAQDRLRRALYVRLWLLDRSNTVTDLQQLATIDQASGRDDRAVTLRHWAGVVAGRGPVDWATLKRQALLP